MKSNDSSYLQAQILIDRLARLSADSLWARRASGVRAALDKAISRPDGSDPEYLERLIQAGFAMLERAARELPHDKVDKSGGID